MPLNPTVPLVSGITEAVNRLSDGGIHTFESCDGSTGHSFSEPTVKFYGTQAEGWKALAICKDYGLTEPSRPITICSMTSVGLIM